MRHATYLWADISFEDNLRTDVADQVRRRASGLSSDDQHIFKLVDVPHAAGGLKAAVADFLPTHRARDDFLQNLRELLRRH